MTQIYVNQMNIYFDDLNRHAKKKINLKFSYFKFMISIVPRF
jgi:hypothetical protein